jgi:hypothetical protein
MLAVASIVDNYRSAVAFTPSLRGRFAPDAIAKGPAAAAKVKQAKATAAHAGIAPAMKALRDGGLTYAAIAKALNEEGETTRYGSQWDAANVLRVIRKYAA